MADWEKKREKTKIQKLEYLENEKSFLHEIKNIFLIVFEGLSFTENKYLIKKADTSFKIKNKFQASLL